MIYTWVSSLNHWTQLFPNSEKLFRRGLKRTVAASEWEFRANNRQTNQQTKKKSRAQIWVLLYAKTEVRWAKPNWHFRVSCCWQYLLHLQASGTASGQSEKSTLTRPSGGKPSAPGAVRRSKTGPGSSQMPARIKRHLLGWEKEASRSCRGRKRDILKGI